MKPLDLTLLVSELEWDYERRGGVSEGEVVAMQIGMKPLVLARSEVAKDKTIRRVPGFGLYEFSGDAVSGVSIGLHRAIILDCGVPIQIGYGQRVPKPGSHIYGLGVLEAFISSEASPIYTPTLGKVIRTSRIGEVVRAYLMTVQLLDGNHVPKWKFDWRPKLFSKAVPRPSGLQIRLLRDGDLYRADVFHPIDTETWMSLGPMSLKKLHGLLKKMGWGASETEDSRVTRPGSPGAQE